MDERRSEIIRNSPGTNTGIFLFFKVICDGSAKEEEEKALLRQTVHYSKGHDKQYQIINTRQ